MLSILFYRSSILVKSTGNITASLGYIAGLWACKQGIVDINIEDNEPTLFNDINRTLYIYIEEDTAFAFP